LILPFMLVTKKKTAEGKQNVCGRPRQNIAVFYFMKLLNSDLAWNKERKGWKELYIFAMSGILLCINTIALSDL
jgi:hypothetical protein